MASESSRRHSWVRVGSTYGAVADATIVALVYHAGAQRGNKGGPGGDQAEAGPGWYLVWVDEPHRHHQLSAPASRAGAPAAEFDQSALVALTEAGDAIEAKRAAGGPGGVNGR